MQKKIVVFIAVVVILSVSLGTIGLPIPGDGDGNAKPSKSASDGVASFCVWAECLKSFFQCFGECLTCSTCCCNVDC